MSISQSLLQVSRLLIAGIDDHPLFRRLKEKIETRPLQLIKVTKSNLHNLPYFDEIRVTGINTQETTSLISLGLRIGEIHYEGNLLYYHTAILPLKKSPLKLQFILNVLSNGSNHLKNERLHDVIRAGLANLEFYQK